MTFRWRRYFERDAGDADLSGEIAQHIEQEADDNVARGMTAPRFRQTFTLENVSRASQEGRTSTPTGATRGSPTKILTREMAPAIRATRLNLIRAPRCE